MYPLYKPIIITFQDDNYLGLCGLCEASMAYGLFRVRELKAGDISSTEIHNARLYEEYGIDRPNNIGPDEEGYHGFNNYYLGQDVDEPVPRLQDKIQERLEDTGVKVRKNSNVAIEIVLGSTPDFWKKYSPDGFFSQARQFIAEEFGGKDNIIAQYSHFDETNPHVHFVVTPIKHKVFKYRNGSGDLHKSKYALCARDFTGSKEKLRGLQDRYHQFCKSFGDRYGIEFYRGTKSEEQTKTYTRETTAELGRLRNDLYSLKQDLEKIEKSSENGLKELREKLKRAEEIEAEKKVVQAKLQEKEKEMKTKVSDLQKRTDIRKAKNKGDGWKKGRDFDIGF